MPKRSPRSGRTNFVDLGPPGPLDPTQPYEKTLADFGMRLHHEIVKRGWNQSDFTRKVHEVLLQDDKNVKFGRDSVSNYIRGVSMPTPVRLNAMAKVLRMKAEELLPSSALRRTAGSKVPALNMRDMGDGNVWLQVNQPVAFDIGLKIMELLKRK